MRNLSRDQQRPSPRQSTSSRTQTLEKPGSPSPSESEVRIGKYRYDPCDELGRGFSSKVYKATEVGKTHPRYAIKAILLSKFKGSSLELLEGEIEIHQSLQHPHIVQLLEVLKTPTHYYLVLEYCPHGSLSDHLKHRGTLPEPQTLHILQQLRSAYAHLLSQGIIHRDIKPANILRNGNNWKLSDFGFATRARLRFKDHIHVGTPLYMAPESIKHNHYSYKSDLYSLGIVLIEMLTGNTPFETCNEQQMHQLKNHDLPAPTLKNPQLKEFISRLCLHSDAKRMHKQEFESFQLEQTEEKDSHTHSTASLQPVTSSDDTSPSHANTKEHRMHFFHSNSLNTEAVSSDSVQTNSEDKPNHISKGHFKPSKFKTNNSRVNSTNCSTKSSRELPPASDQPETPLRPSNPILLNHQLLQQELDILQNHYLLASNIASLQLDEPNRNILQLCLFKLLLKMLRLLCNRNQNPLHLQNWEQYQHCKLHQQLLHTLTTQSELREQQYLTLIKHHDVKSIRTVNRLLPELCSEGALTNKTHHTLKNLLKQAILQQDSHISQLLTKGMMIPPQELEALYSLLSEYQIADERSGEGPEPVTFKRTLVEDYADSQLTVHDYHQLKTLIGKL